MHKKELSYDIIENYEMMVDSIKDQLEGEKDLIANLSNISAFINFYMEDINWAGFYLTKEDELVLGPFQGKPACIRIPFGSGVCGTAAKTKEIQLIENVHNFPGHIPCDGASLSELVIPIIKNDEVYGVLDIDSPIEGRFSDLEKKYLLLAVKEIEKHI